MSNSVSIHLEKLLNLPYSLLEVSSGSQKFPLSASTPCTLSSLLSGSLIHFAFLPTDSDHLTSSISIDLIPCSTSQLWLKFNSGASSTESKIKISVCKTKNPGKLDDYPYLQLLSEGKAEDQVSLRIQKRAEIEPKTLRINFEPAATTRLGAEAKVYEPQSLAELDSARLEGTGGEQIKKQIKGLAEEIRRFGLDSVKDARVEMLQQVEERVAQEETFEKYTENAVLELTEMISDLWGLEEQRAEIQGRINEEETKKNENLVDIDALKARVGALQREVLMLKAERLRFRDLENLLESSETICKAQEESLEKLSSRFEESKIQSGKVSDNSATLIAKLEKETQDFLANLSSIAENEESITQTNQKLKSHLSELRLKLSQQIDAPSLDPSKSSDQRYTGLNKLQSIQSEAFDYDQESKLKFKSSLKQKHSSSDALLSAFIDLETQSHQNLERLINKFIVSSELTYMEQSCCIVGDVSNLTETLSRFSKFYSNTSKSALKHLNSTANGVLKEADTIKSECNKIGGIMNDVLEKDFETDHVKAIMSEIKERHPPYIPTLDDPVDVALFEYIKSSEAPIPVPFTREDEGVYLFGTKRVFLKLENGNLAIRIGGGFTSIKNFVEIYTPIELERQEDVIEETVPEFRNTQSRFSHSPQKGMSPIRAARILQGTVEVKASSTPIKNHSPIRKTPVKK